MTCPKCRAKARIRDSFSIGAERRTRIECPSCGPYTAWVKTTYLFQPPHKRKLT